MEHCIPVHTFATVIRQQPRRLKSYKARAMRCRIGGRAGDERKKKQYINPHQKRKDTYYEDNENCNEGRRPSSHGNRNDHQYDKLLQR